MISQEAKQLIPCTILSSENKKNRESSLQQVEGGNLEPLAEVMLSPSGGDGAALQAEEGSRA